MADRRISIILKGQGHNHLFDSGMPVWNGNLGNDRTSTQSLQVWKTTGYEKSKVVQRSVTERLGRSRLLWAGHVERKVEDILPKRAAGLLEQCRRRDQC